MPMDRKRYPHDWPRIALEVKDAADWKCQECGKQCRRPGEKFDTHRRTLTVAHLNHMPEDCRCTAWNEDECACLEADWRSKDEILIDWIWRHPGCDVAALIDAYITKYKETK